MSKFGKFPGMGGNLNDLLKQAQQVQKDMEKVQEDLETKTVQASAGGGAVSVTVTGKKTIKEIVIKPEVVNPDDVEMLQDLIIAALNEALRKADELAASEMKRFNIPGLGL